MNPIFKIVAYYPEENRIEVKFCDQKSDLSIDDYLDWSINCSDLDMHDMESFTDSLIRKYGLRQVEKQIKERTIHEDNYPEVIESEDVNLDQLVGKVVEGKYFSRPRYPIKMRRIEL